MIKLVATEDTFYVGAENKKIEIAKGGAVSVDEAEYKTILGHSFIEGRTADMTTYFDTDSWREVLVTK